LKLIAKLTEAN